MFGFLIGKEINDDAVRLNMLCGNVKKHFMTLPKNALKEKLEKEFIDSNKSIRDDDASIVFDDLPSFIFNFYFSGPFEDQFQVIGRGKYAGFSLHWAGDSKNSSAQDGISYSATGGARKLAQVMAKKFGFIDISRTMNRLMRP
ncbi:hypothetical protein [Nitratireductor luteus]|uniref:hypothetical protein n=1 Tax=Nitratireductor luteus TaxID=2976980 RepID=UPI00223FD1C2|nr:hypothetical protein [Nitratireductor luteus]